jgi:hypothetical protein
MMTRKKITLPSGATCVVRKVSAGDLAIHLGDVPTFDGTPSAAGAPSNADIARGVEYMRIAVLVCCSPLTMPDGKRLRVVDKDLDKLTDGEIAIGELSDADAQCIFDSVAEISGIRKEAAESSAKPFPEEQESPAVA